MSLLSLCFAACHHLLLYVHHHIMTAGCGWSVRVFQVVLVAYCFSRTSLITNKSLIIYQHNANVRVRELVYRITQNQKDPNTILYLYHSVMGKKVSTGRDVELYGTAVTKSNCLSKTL
jgi:hypothetical protein